MSTQQIVPSRPSKWMRDCLNDGDYWRAHAEEARTKGEAMQQPESQRVMEGIARGYDRLAEQADKELLTWPEGA